MLHDLPQPVLDRMRDLEAMDAADRLGSRVRAGTPRGRKEATPGASVTE